MEKRLNLEEAGRIICDEHFATCWYMLTKNPEAIGHLCGDEIVVEGFTRIEFYALCWERAPFLAIEVKELLGGLL